MGVKRRPTADQYQDGYATVELALTIPILFAVAAVAVWCAHLGVLQLTLQSRASIIARNISRGVTHSDDLNQEGSRIHESVSKDGDTVSVALTQDVDLPLVRVSVTIKAKAIAKLEPDVDS